MNLLVPVLAAVGVGMKDALTPYGGIPTLLISVALSASLAMILPISTPPNAIAYSTDMIKQKDMAIVGIFAAVVGLLASFALLIGLGTLKYFNS